MKSIRAGGPEPLPPMVAIILIAACGFLIFVLGGH
jgi:hypothetical protein